MSVCCAGLGHHKSLSHLLNTPSRASGQSINCGLDPVGERLRDISENILLLCNDRDFESPYLSYLAEDFTADHENGPVSRNRVEHAVGIRRLLDANPEYHSEILNSSVQFKSKGRRAVVWNFLWIGGLRDRQGRESVSLLHWERRARGWVCVRFEGLRGVGGCS